MLACNVDIFRKKKTFYFICYFLMWPIGDKWGEDKGTTIRILGGGGAGVFKK